MTYVLLVQETLSKKIIKIRALIICRYNKFKSPIWNTKKKNVFYYYIVNTVCCDHEMIIYIKWVGLDKIDGRCTRDDE